MRLATAFKTFGKATCWTKAPTLPQVCLPGGRSSRQPVGDCLRSTVPARFAHHHRVHAPIAAAASGSMSGTPVRDSMHQKLSDRLKPVSLDIVDESSKHAGHAAMKGLNASETHFNVSVVSQEFEGLTTIKRHKLVYQVLADELSGPVHALSLKTKTPAEVSQ